MICSTQRFPTRATASPSPAHLVPGSRLNRSSRASLALALCVLWGGSALWAPLAQAAASYRLLDALEVGVFNIGPGDGRTLSATDEETQRDVLKFDYALPAGSIIGVWTKSYPPQLGPEAADAISLGVKVLHPDQVAQIAVKVEVKGSRGMQTIPLELHAGWTRQQEAISWGAIGELREVVFVISPMAVGPLSVSPIGVSPAEVQERVSGTLYLDAEFGPLSFLQRYWMYLKVLAVLLLGLLAALLASLIARFWPTQQTAAGLSGLARDGLYGVAAVALAWLAWHVHAQGTFQYLNVRFGCLALGLLAAGLVGLVKWGLTGKRLTAREAFEQAVLTGLLAVSSSRQEVLQGPGSWAQELMLNGGLATLTFLIYQIANLTMLSSAGRLLRPVTSMLIVATPYLFNWLLLLGSPALLQELAGVLTLGLLSTQPLIAEVLGRFLVVLGFNEAVLNGISLATKGRWLRTAKGHGWIACVSLNAVAAPYVADWGSTAAVAGLPVLVRMIIGLATVMLSYAGLWGVVYLITGALLDGLHHHAPSQEKIWAHVQGGVRKGMAYSGILLALLFALRFVVDAPAAQALMHAAPLLVGVAAGALLFPLLKTLIETFDGSLRFIDRVWYSYHNPVLYARGGVVGLGFALMLTRGVFAEHTAGRVLFGLGLGVLASTGISLGRDLVYGCIRKGRIQSWRLYLVDGLLGAFVGGAAAFYLDTRQVPVVVDKFRLYTSAGFDAVQYVTYPLVNKWGRMDLGTYAGGVKLLFIESLAGVINWAVAAWLFAINKVLLQAYFEKDASPIRHFFSKTGFTQLIEHMLYVLRWGLWMSPIIFTFLRMMPEPTWYNQDGALRTLVAMYQHLTLPPELFQQWSLEVFVSVLAYDAVRVLIWMDHMGLRVATLVNLSFIGLDRLDERAAKFIGPAAAQRYIPEAIKRFATWAPLLIPFYLPRGQDWDYAWGKSQAIILRQAGQGGLSEALAALNGWQLLLVLGGGILIAAALSRGLRTWAQRRHQGRDTVYQLANREYRLVAKASGEVYSEVIGKAFDVTRRSYDRMDPCGRALFLVDTAKLPAQGGRAWPVLGNFPTMQFDASRVSRQDQGVQVVNDAQGLHTTITMSLPDPDATVEIWTITLENASRTPRQLALVPYLEWVLNRPLDDRFHTQYARLFVEMEYVSAAHAILAKQRTTKSMGVLATDLPPTGLLTSRVEFIGRARSLWQPRSLETLAFHAACDTSGYPTFDPIGSLLVPVTVGPQSRQTVRLLIGYAKHKEAALDLVTRFLPMQPAAPAAAAQAPVRKPLIGHGEIPPGTPQPYCSYRDEGKTLVVHTPYTPRPFDHALANALGHSVMVTNRGLHTSCNANSQQNRLTPDWPDTTTSEVPSEAIYLYEPARGEWYAPTHHPLNDPRAQHEVTFSVDGTAVFRMTRGTLATELTVFVPPEDPVGLYLLTIKNQEDQPRQLRVAPYFQMVMAFQAERSGPLGSRYEPALNALFFENPRNTFRVGTAFVAMTLEAQHTTTQRGRFFGAGYGVAHPYFVEANGAANGAVADDRAAAVLMGTVDIPARGERTIAVMLGQAGTPQQAAAVVEKYRSIDAVQQSLAHTRQWWASVMGTLKVETNQPEFDSLLHWLKYQALVERIWARRGFYQTSGAYGFRDQLQDAVNLIWLDPTLARRQILLHAAQQFLEGDVFHWFFTLADGRTAFACRSHASDNPLWLVWAVVEYLRATGDESILEEMTSYVASENPFLPLPKNKQGWGGLYQRVTRADTVFQHCLRSLNLVLRQRMGAHGLPLMGTGDWNDGLDEIGSEGKGESVWLGFFLVYILKGLLPYLGKRQGAEHEAWYAQQLNALQEALEQTWRTDRYLRAIHDDGTEIGVKDSGIWEIDALTAAWAVMAGMNPQRARTVFDTALKVLERDNAILLGWPALREDTKPYLGRSSKYPEGVRENGMYCHGVQWLIKAARVLVEQSLKENDSVRAQHYRDTAYRLWLKVSPIPHAQSPEIEMYGGQPNKQAADLLTTFDQGRMIWNGYTGAAGWMLREALEGVVGAAIVQNELQLPDDLHQLRDGLSIRQVRRDTRGSPLAETLSALDLSPR
jgi:cyclic beta-1,2-glucan synthetase